MELREKELPRSSEGRSASSTKQQGNAKISRSQRRGWLLDILMRCRQASRPHDRDEGVSQFVHSLAPDKRKEASDLAMGRLYIDLGRLASG